MERQAVLSSWVSRLSVLSLMMLFSLTGCVTPGGQSEIIAPPPNDPPLAPNVVELDPYAWSIFYSSGMPPSPSQFNGGAWAFEFPSFQAGGHVNYVQTPFRQTTTLHSVVITFRVESNQPTYVVIDPTDITPATFHVFFEQQNDDLIEPNGRWWASPGYNLGSQDNQTLTFTIPLTSGHWSNVDGLSDPGDFAAAWQNVGWMGITFGGQYYWGHGVALAGGTAQFILVDFEVQ